jgi:hypothetical protein
MKTTEMTPFETNGRSKEELIRVKNARWIARFAVPLARAPDPVSNLGGVRPIRNIEQDPLMCARKVDSGMMTINFSERKSSYPHKSEQRSEIRQF